MRARSVQLGARVFIEPILQLIPGVGLTANDAYDRDRTTSGGASDHGRVQLDSGVPLGQMLP